MIGSDMIEEMKKFGAEIVGSCRDMVARALAPLDERLKSLEDRPLPVPVDGAKGMDGAQGEKGEKGDKGDPGMDGKDGRDGKDGEKGDPGKDGKDGMHGAKGIDGTDGQRGEDGEPGRDALELDVLPGIDETRRYRRGTYAQHMGGLWRSMRTTEGMDGWECIVRGIASIESTYEEDGRVVHEKHTLSDGSHVTHTRQVPIMIYRGVFKDGAVYKQGDTVTWAGSMWHCNESTGEKPIDGVGAWTLATKRGRDAK
jgi:hypothetical protein